MFRRRARCARAESFGGARVFLHLQLARQCFVANVVGRAQVRSFASSTFALRRRFFASDRFLRDEDDDETLLATKKTESLYIAKLTASAASLAMASC